MVKFGVLRIYIEFNMPRTKTTAPKLSTCPLARPLTVAEAKKWLRVGSVVVANTHPKDPDEWYIETIRTMPYLDKHTVIQHIEHGDRIVLLER